MKGDLLSEATRALRESVDGTCDDARAAEERLMALVPRVRRARRSGKAWTFSLAALLIGSSVLAMGRTQVGRWLETFAAQTSVGSGDELPRVTADRERLPGPQRVDEPESAPEEPPTAQEELPPAPRLVPSDSPRAPARTPVVVSAREPSSPAPSLEGEIPRAEPTADPRDALDVYERAHDLHFKSRDYAAALAMWDRYLELAPNGALSLEARFHRGVCFIRLGQKESARRVLEPFARGDYGTYRKAEAQKLLGDN